MTDFGKADLDWRDDRTPVSKTYDDVYFSLSNGLDESRFVFLNGVGGSKLWDGKEAIAIGETGFGTGLNFLVTWQEWLKSAQPFQRLTYVSVEGFPLDRDQLAKSLAQWDELGELRNELLTVYPELTPGFHSIQFEDGRITLLLLFGEVKDVLSRFTGSVDAWYLDGFAPSKNPDMWNENVYRLLAEKSNPDCKLATFTSAGHVRRGLEEVGFEIHKAKGYRYKKERIVGEFLSEKKRKTNEVLPSWFHLASPKKIPKKVAVIGSGIVGNCLSFVLDQNGLDVTLIDKNSSLAGGASGNPAAVFEPKLMRGGAVLGEFLASSYLNALNFYRELETQSGKTVWHHRCGSLDLIPDAKELQRRQNFDTQTAMPRDHYAFVSAREASELAGVEIKNSALWYPQAGCLNTGALAEVLTKNVNVILGKKVTSLHQDSDEGKAKWSLMLSETEEVLEFDCVVLANAFNISNFLQLEELPVVMNRGQVSTFDEGFKSSQLKTVVSGSGYVTPSVEGQHVFGATYERLYCFDEAEDRSVTMERHEHNLEFLTEYMPSLAKEISLDKLGGRTSVRGTTTDRFPLVGPVHDDTFYRDNYSKLKNGLRSQSNWAKAEYYDGLYCAAGFGSRGFLTAPLMAEYLTKLILGEALPIPVEFIEAVHPARFVIRDQKKGL